MCRQTRYFTWQIIEFDLLWENLQVLQSWKLESQVPVLF